MALEKQYPQQAAELYRMLWRYTDKQLEFGDDGKGGEDAKLVRALDDDLLAVRVLSYANLKEITGKGEIYRPGVHGGASSTGDPSTGARGWRRKRSGCPRTNRRPAPRSMRRSPRRLPTADSSDSGIASK